MTTPSAASSSEVAIDEKHGAPSEMVKPPMAGLSEQEKEIIERQIEAPKLDVGYFALFRYASRNEFIIMVIAVIASIAAGAVMPLMTVCLSFSLSNNPGPLKKSSSNTS
jgi:ATP-binding cassette subfamily B (MDR/TAP) protein 1